MEELEATLQELDDLQQSVCELTADNEKLTDERTILLESLCTQTKKLENARLQVTIGLTQLLLLYHLSCSGFSVDKYGNTAIC